MNHELTISVFSIHRGKYVVTNDIVMLKSYFSSYFLEQTKILFPHAPTENRINLPDIGDNCYLTAVMAKIACSYALYTVMDNVYMAKIFGLIWGQLIFHLDRFLVSTIK